MIIRPRPGLFELVFALRGSIVPRVAPHVALAALLACLGLAREILALLPAPDARRLLRRQIGFTAQIGAQLRARDGAQVSRPTSSTRASPL